MVLKASAIKGVDCIQIQYSDIEIERYRLHAFNAYVANGGWVPRSQGAGTVNPNPGR